MSDDPPILTLPSEILGHIFSLLSPQDATACRQVCHKFAADVDEFVEFSATLDETKGSENGWFLPRVLNLRLSEVIIQSMIGPPSLFGHVGTQLLRYPYLLRTLRLPPESKVSVENLHYLILDSAPSLQQIDLCLTPPVSLTPTNLGLSPTTFSYKFKKLRSLSLSLTTLPATQEEAMVFVETQLMQGPPTAIMEDALPILLLSSKMEVIRDLRIQIRCLGFRQISQLTTLTLQLVTRCSETLKSFDFDLIQGCIQGQGLPTTEERSLSDSDMEKLDLVALRKVKSLQDLRIVNSTAVGVALWKEVLGNQQSLQIMETDILPAPASLFRQIILNNSTTLVEVDIGDLTLDFNEETGSLVAFDLSVFTDCCRLKKLTLDRNSLTRRRGPLLQPELVQLSYLPESLAELNINYFFIPSEELLLLFNSSGRSLSSISLTQCGDSGVFGVNGSVLQAIISLPTIQYIEVSPLNHRADADVGGDGTEAQKLNLILITFGYTEGHSYFQLKRVDPKGNVGGGGDVGVVQEDKVGMSDLEVS